MSVKPEGLLYDPDWPVDGNDVTQGDVDLAIEVVEEYTKALSAYVLMTQHRQRQPLRTGSNLYELQTQSQLVSGQTLARANVYVG